MRDTPLEFVEAADVIALRIQPPCGDVRAAIRDELVNLWRLGIIEPVPGAISEPDPHALTWGDSHG